MLEQVSVGKQAPVLGEGDKQDPVQQALGRLDRSVQLGHALGLKLLDQLDPALRVFAVQLHAHLLLPLARLSQQPACVLGEHAGSQQAVGMEDRVELGELVRVVQLGQEHAVHMVRRLLAAVEPDLGVVADDGPLRRFGGVEVVPDLLNGGDVPRGHLPVKVDLRPLQLDHDQRLAGQPT